MNYDRETIVAAPVIIDEAIAGTRSGNEKRDCQAAKQESEDP